MYKYFLLFVLFSCTILQAQNYPPEWSANGWLFSGWNGTNLDSSSTLSYVQDSSATQGSFSQYFSSGGQTQMLLNYYHLFSIYWSKSFLDTEIPISFLFDFKAKDIDSISAVYLQFTYGRHFNWAAANGIHDTLEMGQWNNVQVNAIINPPSNQFNFIEFELGFMTSSSTIMHFEYLIDNLRLVYSDTTILIDDFGDGMTNINTTSNGQNLNQYSISQNFPNPFNSNTVIQYSIPREDFVEIIVYDISGSIVKKLVNELKPAGNHSVLFKADNFASRIYFYQLKTSNFNKTKSLVLLR
jgi:hypothetical protein